MDIKSIKIAEIRQLVREMVEANFAQPQPAPTTKPEKETEVAPNKEKEQQPRRRTLPNPEKAPEHAPKGEKQPTATEMAIANKMADKFNKLSGK